MTPQFVAQSPEGSGMHRKYRGMRPKGSTDRDQALAAAAAQQFRMRQVQIRSACAELDDAKDYQKNAESVDKGSMLDETHSSGNIWSRFTRCLFCVELA